jgi:hypothetical protein
MHDILQRRGVKDVVCFHCDHFEPFRINKSGNRTGLEYVERWLEATLGMRHSRYATPFYSTQRFCVLPDGAHGPHHLPGDKLQFGDNSMAKEDAAIIEAIRAAARDFQIHIHHEYWTSGVHTKTAPDPVQDGQRLAFFLELISSYYDRRIGMPKQWAFVHGCWALNASDAEICHIVDEIKILQKFGCVADFSFPAGRSHCDPSWKVPSYVQPIVGKKAYDLPEADPLPARVASLPPKNRFLIWNSQLSSADSSLDTLVTTRADPVQVARRWLENSPVIDGVLFIKTHCHSMWWEYWDKPTDRKSPLLAVKTRVAFLAVEDAVYSTPGARLCYSTVSEVLNMLGAYNEDARNTTGVDGS